MTASYSIPETISHKFRFRSKPVDPQNIKAVVPTYRDWDGLRITLDSLLNLKMPPKKIAVANDNAEKGIPSWLANYPVDVVDYDGNLGPAKARNRGFGQRAEIPFEKFLGAFNAFASQGTPFPDYIKNGFCPEIKFKDFAENPTVFEWDSPVDWYYFTDCGCTHDPDLFLKFEAAWRDCGDCCVAISGPVTGSGSGPINEYMTEQGVLNPPLERDLHGVYIPQAIVTANALVAGLPFAVLGGFDPEFQEAAGEDLDLGIRLREFGVIAWSREAQVSHRFEGNEADLIERFRRYGRGNRKLELKHGLPCLRARPIRPEKPEHERLANLSVKAMQVGYDEAVDPTVRGVLRILPG